MRNPSEKRAESERKCAPVVPVEMPDDTWGVSAAEIEAKMETDGFPELKWLWGIFKGLGNPLLEAEAEVEEVSCLRESHMGDLLSHPYLMTTASLAAAGGLSYYLGSALGPLSAIDQVHLAVFGCLSFYLTWFAAAVLQRTLEYPWKEIAARDLAMMLKRRGYREWFDATPRAKCVMRRLRNLGVSDLWDDPKGKVWLKAADGGFELVKRAGPGECVQMALREALGSKEDQNYKPGRYYGNLKAQKKSVTRFVMAHLEAITASKEGLLPVSEGLSLLKELKETEMIPGSAGDLYLAGVIESLEGEVFLPNGVVEAGIWERDPWTDLTNSRDFFSSASLRGDSFRDTLERRTKGAMGPFGYLRNKSVSAMDFRTRSGRSVRARIAAVVVRDRDDFERPVLFVDAVEGRFDIKPALVRRVIEEYARAAGFVRVFYHKYPLNRVPMRFAKHLEDSDARLEELDIEYIDSERREYLDAFGLPLEPFEYARPKGRVIGYSVDIGDGVAADPVAPGVLKLALSGVKGKSALWALAGASLACLAWVLYKMNPMWILPAGAACVLAAVYEFVIAPKFLRRISRVEKTVGESKKHAPAFVEKMIAEIEKNEVAIKMSYPARIAPKAAKLLEFFDEPSQRLSPFFEVVLSNTSMKDSHIENLLKFMRNLEGEKRGRVAGLFELLWPARDEAAVRVGLSEDKAGRVEAMKKLAARIEGLRKHVKTVPPEGWDADLIRKAGAALEMPVEDVLSAVGLRPKILRGLKKPPRPMVAWIIPMAAASAGGYLLMTLAPRAPSLLTYGLMMSILVPGTWLISTRLAIAPGILCYEKTRRRLREVLKGCWKPSRASLRMSALGVNTDEYAKNRAYEDKEKGIRIEIRDKRTLKGALEFLTSSEEIGNCLALRNFVSWCLPSLLNDETIMLADVSLKGSSHAWHQRAQLWMVAAELKGEPVLTVNSVEFNNEGAKYINTLMPAMVEVLRDVCRRAGFKGIYMGISDFGREWCDARFAQGDVSEPIVKIHHPELGGAYYFDAYRPRLGGGYEYMKKRSFLVRAYAVIFGMIERLKGNSAKADSFFDSAKNVNNLWEVPLV